jgi:hypothetical protein
MGIYYDLLLEKNCGLSRSMPKYRHADHFGIGMPKLKSLRLLLSAFVESWAILGVVF